jgi:uncharacterized OB-fold protein
MGSKTTEEIQPVASGIFTLPPYKKEGPKLLGGYCPDCDRYYFPAPKYCKDCFGSLDNTDLGSEGIIYTYTVIRVKPPLGLPEPYAVGYIDLAKTGLRIFCLLDHKKIDQLDIGSTVLLCVEELGNNGRGQRVLRPYFTPQKTKK